MNTMNTRNRYAADTLTIVRQSDNNLTRDVLTGAPCEWSKERGATHTLVIDTRGIASMGDTRPAKLLKTVLFVGIDETADGGILWERWSVKAIATCAPGTHTPPQHLAQ